jgi:DNA topoisomerase VI subunit A
VKAVDININNNQYKSTFSDVLSFCVKSYSNICKSNHDAIICVENRMCFDQFNPSVFEQKFTNPLIVFRGSPEFPINASMNLMKNMNIPTYSYCDIDPSGILIALSLPNFKDAITPIGWREKLENLGSFDLFLKQGRVKVDTSKHTNLNTMSKEINRLKKGLVQEAFILSSLINY